MGNPPERALVLGKDTRSFLAVVRSLGRAGVEVHVGWHGRDPVALRSRYVALALDLPEPDVDEGWEEPILALLRRERFDLVLPTNDPAILALHRLRGSLDPAWRVWLPSPRALDACLDKLATWELARSLDLPVPRQVRVRDPGEARAAAAELGFPVAVKSRIAFALGRRKWEHNVVRIARDELQLEAYLGARLEVGEALVQEHVPGDGVGVELLAEGGEVLLAFQHRRVHELLTGGSSYRRSERLNPELLDAARRLMKALDYTGVAMVEFREERATGRWRLIEINARTWGSLPLAVACGADFPRALYRLLVHGEREPARAYRSGICCRNWWMDLHWLEHHRDAVPRVMGEWLRVLALRERSDTFVLDDPLPGLIDARRNLRAVGGIVLERLHRLALEIGPVRRRHARRLGAAVAGARSLLFVCKGNICRSPFAEAHARSLLPGSVEVRSAGYRGESGRPCPREAVAVARALGHDLRGHRSVTLDDDLIDEADLVFVFDEPTRRAVLERRPAAGAKVQRLGLLAADAPLNIKDPYGGPFEGYERTYRDIARAMCGALAEGSDWRGAPP